MTSSRKAIRTEARQRAAEQRVSRDNMGILWKSKWKRLHYLGFTVGGVRGT